MLVSICIPSYNHAEFLPDAIESCLNQTYKNIEIVIADDNSSDESLSIARAYERRYPSLIRVFTHPGDAHQGPAATVNLAISKFKGDFYCGLPSDDVFYPEKTEKQVNYLLEHPDIGWVYSKAKWFGAKSDIVSTMDLSQEPNALESMIIVNRIWGVTVMGRKDVWQRVGDHDERLICADWDFWTRMLQISKVGYVDEVLAGVRIHSRNTSVTDDWKTLLRYNVDVMTVLLERQFEPRHLALVNLMLSKHLFELGELSEARSRLEEAFTVFNLSPGNLASFVRLISADYLCWALTIDAYADRFRAEV